MARMVSRRTVVRVALAAVILVHTFSVVGSAGGCAAARADDEGRRGSARWKQLLVRLRLDRDASASRWRADGSWRW